MMLQAKSEIITIPEDSYENLINKQVSLYTKNNMSAINIDCENFDLYKNFEKIIIINSTRLVRCGYIENQKIAYYHTAI